MFYPPAFDMTSLELIGALVRPEKRIEVSKVDALSFACNVVQVDGCIFMNDCSTGLRSRLSAVGLTPTVTLLSEFVKAGVPHT
jgi:N-dimethylarginine dimethylaminohydrolase